MATLLDKDLVRESTIKIGEREIVVTIGADQTISMKLKGMKTGSVSISIEDLYNKLAGSGPTVIQATQKKASDGPMMSLHDIRHRSNVRGFDYATTVKFDNLLNELIEENKK